MTWGIAIAGAVVVFLFGVVSTFIICVSWYTLRHLRALHKTSTEAAAEVARFQEQMTFVHQQQASVRVEVRQLRNAVNAAAGDRDGDTSYGMVGYEAAEAEIGSDVASLGNRWSRLRTDEEP